MKLKTEHIVIGGVVVALAVFSKSFKDRLINKLASFIPSVEGFRSSPYWDESRYSWGYGTKAPGSTGTITREKAFADMVGYLMADYARIAPRLTRQLSVNQWAALLSFSYNLGYDDAYDIVPFINSGNDAALATQWRRYNHSSGVVNPVLTERREKELTLWFS